MKQIHDAVEQLGDDLAASRKVGVPSSRELEASGRDRVVRDVETGVDVQR